MEQHKGLCLQLLYSSTLLRHFYYDFYIKVPPQVSPFYFGEEPLNRGEVASVVCTVPKGDLPLDIYWTINSALIVSGENGFNVFKMNKRASALNIESLEAMHRGLYKCIANNSAGYSEHIAELKVNGLCNLEISFLWYKGLVLCTNISAFVAVSPFLNF